MAEEKKKVGRPTTYTKKLAEELCKRIVEGESLRSICRSDGMPDLSTVFRWLPIHKEFKEQYEKAMEARADTLLEEIVDIADDGSNDWMVENDPENPGYKANGEHIQRSRLRVDARKWAASKLRPKKYGDKVSTELSGPGGVPFTLNFNKEDEDL